MGPEWIPILSVFGGIAASSGFWAWLSKRDTLKGATTQLLLGLAHDRIIHLGMHYLERGWLTKDEYEDFFKYLVKPYTHFGGNGLAEKVVADVKKLPIYSHRRKPEDVEIITKDKEQ